MEQAEKDLALALARLVLARRGLALDKETVADLADQALEAVELRADDYDTDEGDDE